MGKGELDMLVDDARDDYQDVLVNPIKHGGNDHSMFILTSG